MTGKVMKVIAASVLSASFIAGFSSAVSASGNVTDLGNGNNSTLPITVSPVGNGSSQISPQAIGNTFTMVLDGKTKDPSKSFTVSTSYPNLTLYAKNQGSEAFRVEVRHDVKGTVVFNKTFSAHSSNTFKNNDENPPVPPGNYTVTVYGGKGYPSGSVELKSNNTKW